MVYDAKLQQWFPNDDTEDYNFIVTKQYYLTVPAKSIEQAKEYILDDFDDFDEFVDDEEIVDIELD